MHSRLSHRQALFFLHFFFVLTSQSELDVVQSTCCCKMNRVNARMYSFAVVEVPAADHAAGGPPPPPGATTTAPRGVTPPPGGGRARSRSWGTFFFGMAWAERKGAVKSGAFGGGDLWDAGRLRERYEV